MLDFYFKIAFTNGHYDEYIHVIAATASMAWNILNEELKTLGWDEIDYGKTGLVFPHTFQKANGEFYENFKKTS